METLPSVKRRRLTKSDLEAVEPEGPKSAKKDFANSVNVKKETSAEQELPDLETDKSGIKMHDLWLQVKKEIKAELDLTLSSFDEAIQKIWVKEEIKQEQRQHLEDYHSKISKEGPNSAKKDFANGVNVKKETHAEREADLQSVDKSGMKMQNLWLQVKKERNSSESAASPKDAMKSMDSSAEAHHFCLEHGRVMQKSLCDMCMYPICTLCSQVATESAQSSLAAFASQAVIWAKQCLAFRSLKTWSPTRRCSRAICGFT